MRIGINTRILVNKNHEGVHRYIYETTLQMAVSHPEDEFILFFDRKVSVDFGFPANVKSVIVPWHARHPILWYWWFEIMMPIYLWWYKIDVFYSGDGYMSLRTSVPTVMVMHDLAYLHYPEYVDKRSLSYYKYYVPKYLRKASQVITVSTFVKNDIIDRFSIPEDKVLVAYNAVSEPMDTSHILIPKPIADDIDGHPYFLYVGAIHPRKNIINLIEAFHIFNQDNKYKLVLAGRLAWDTDEIKQSILDSPAIIHTGMVSEAVKYKLISGAVAMTYISVFEGFGIPLLEAMKTGTPVITSNVSSMPEVAGDAALLVSPTDKNDIANAMKAISSDNALRQDLIKKGYERYRYFSWNKSAEIIYNAITALKNKNSK